MGQVADQAPSASAGSPPPVRAFRSLPAWLVLIGTFSLGLLVDLGSKRLVFERALEEPVVLDRQALLANPRHNPIPPHAGLQALPWGLLEFQLVINRGAVFGLGEDKRFFFICFTVAALVAALLVFARHTWSTQQLAHVAIALVLAGGLGNLYDRMTVGVVRDFLHMLPGCTLPFDWRWPGGSPELFPWVFNAADVMLLVGMGLLMIHMSRVDRQRQAARARQLAAVELET